MEPGKVAVSIVESMKAQPIVLALFIIILAMLAIMWRISEGLAVQREREVRLIYDQQSKIQDMLSRCVVPKALLEVDPGDFK